MLSMAFKQLFSSYGTNDRALLEESPIEGQGKTAKEEGRGEREIVVLSRQEAFYRDSLGKLEGRLHRVEEENRRYMDEIGKYNRELRQHQGEVSYWRGEAHRLREEHRRSEAARAELAGSFSFLRDQHSSLLLDYDQLHSVHRQDKALLQSRSAELQSAMAFLGTSDEQSGEEVLQAVEDINTEVMQVAASIAEGVGYKREESTGNLVETHLHAAYLSEAFANYLRQRDHSNDPTLVQYALQSCFTYHISVLAQKFCIGLDTQVDEFLVHLFQEIQSSHIQPVAGRWGALAHSHCRLESPSVTSVITHDILKDFAVILTISGCTNPVYDQYYERIQSVVTSVVKLFSNIRENVLSKSYLIFDHRPDTDFNHLLMKDIFSTADQQSEMQFNIWCSIGLGLGYVIKIGDGSFDQKVLLKALVMGGNATEIFETG